MKVTATFHNKYKNEGLVSERKEFISQNNIFSKGRVFNQPIPSPCKKGRWEKITEQRKASPQELKWWAAEEINRGNEERQESTEEE